MKPRSIFGGLVAALLMFSALSSALAQAPGSDRCASLAQLKAPNLTITSATALDSLPSFGRGQGGGNGDAASAAVPFCRVVGFLTPTNDSHIGFEVWLPVAASWNHKFEGVGNGGFSGSVNLRAMVPGLMRGYATMATDYGHLNIPSNPTEDVTWALGHPEKSIDYSYRAEHLTTIVAKQIIDTYYGAEPAHSYYMGCSAGGIQGITEMFRFPKDYDGYVVGDGTPAHMGQELGAFWNALAASLADEAHALTPDQIALVHDNILKQCVGKDGGVSTDPFLSNPEACKFEPKSLLCSAGQDPATCLGAAQVAELDKIYQGPVDAVTHERVLAGLTPGGEATWRLYFSGKKNPIGVERPWAGFMANIAEGDADYLSHAKYLTFNWGSDLAKISNQKLAGETLDSAFNIKTRNLDPVKDEGGKVIQYHGWEDGNIPPMESVKLFKDVAADQAKRHQLSSQQALAETKEFYRLFVVPGMGHCAGGSGPSAFGQTGGSTANDDPKTDTLTALELWVEKGTAPDYFIGSHTDAKTKAVDMTRPICAYPLIPTYKGSGNVNDASNFVCANGPAVAAR